MLGVCAGRAVFMRLVECPVYHIWEICVKENILDSHALCHKYCIHVHNHVTIHKRYAGPTNIILMMAYDNSL